MRLLDGSRATLCRSLLAGTALLLATAATGLADAPVPPKPDPGACNAEQMAVLDEAFAAARTRTAEAIRFLDANPQHAHVQRWFGGATRKLVRVNLTLIAQALEPDSRPALRCDALARSCARALASASQQTATLNFCPSFFRRGTDGHNARFGVVVHEVSHVAAGTRDAAYEHGPSEALAKQEPAVAVTNADNYEYFVETLPR